ncbi:iron dicitrate transporter FecR [Parapedobacter pyrenivorans]|uniref:Iron dicitrate transporter FecR n=1 Tax=Parapedobacter pyrenivorans TaxID=1305674 RepID=A0A917HSI4_9SPHI|nr:FecR family protein [Parapedobacter pyrenivorans]GGG88123.1 iron dicitrate transporter FecR [Parapedobacter pyrenivorans]
MPDRYEYLAQLIANYLRQELTAEEQRALNEWLAERLENREFLDGLNDTQHLSQKLQIFHAVERTRLWELTQRKLEADQVIQTSEEEHDVPSKTHILRRWMPYVAAMLLATSVVTWFYVNDRAPSKSETVSIPSTDVPPGGNRATLTLAGGRTITLDEARDGIVIGDGEITYNDGDPLATLKPGESGRSEKEDVVAEGEIVFLELTTPKGGTYQITLPDGTRVWLNASSTLKYPSRFTEKERVVELAGEGYFEVNRQKDIQSKFLPFKVITNGQTVEVLGTKFNVSAYPDDEEERTTLVEGAVRLWGGTGGEHITLVPGEQGTLVNGNIAKAPVDTDQYTAWMNGRFHFNHTSFDEMIRQVARWYDVEVTYRGTIPQETFTGKMQRDLSLLTILDLLNISNAKIKLEGRTLIVQ